MNLCALGASVVCLGAFAARQAVSPGLLDRMPREEPLMTVAGILARASLLVTARKRLRAVDFEGRAAVITGGSPGLGPLIAHELGRRGAQVTIVR